MLDAIYILTGLAGFVCCGHHQGLRPAVRRTTQDYLIAGITTLFLLVS